MITKITYLLTPYSTVVLERLTGFQLINKFPAFYGTRNVHHRNHKCPQPVPIFSQLDPIHIPTSQFLKTEYHVRLSLIGSYQNISPVPRLCLWAFRNKIRFNSEELWAPRPNPKLEDHTLSAVRDCLFNIFAALSILRTTVAQRLRCCATNRKVAGSIPDGVTGVFHWHNPSERTMALGSTQPLTEMSTGSISWW